MSERIVITCDECKKEIRDQQRFVNAGVYGIHLHEGCINKLSARDIIVMFNLDDIKIMILNDWQGSVKAPSYWRRNK